MRGEDGEERVLLRFRDGPLAVEPGMADMTGSVPVSALGGWPPPPYLLVMPVPSGQALGLVPIAEVTDRVRETLAKDRWRGALVLYRRLRMSDLGDEAADAPHLARGAEYELEEEVGDAR